MAPELQGTILVSGGTGGLGRSVLADLLDGGARVVSTWLVEREVEAVRAELGERDNLVLVQADLSSDEGAAAAVEEAAGDGPLAGLANLVGGFSQGGRLHEAPPEEFTKM